MEEMTDCPFCKYQNNGKKLDYENEYLYIVVPREPAMYGHVLVVSKKLTNEHVKDIADPKLPKEQLESMIVVTQLLAQWMKNELSYEGKSVEKIYVLSQCETPHFHFHLKPRYQGEENGDVFLCLKELEEARWETEDSLGTDKNLEGLARLQKIELSLCKYRALINSRQWTRGDQKRKSFVRNIERDLNRLIKRHRSELRSLNDYFLRDAGLVVSSTNDVGSRNQ